LSRNRDNVRVTAVYGGVSYGPQLKAFREGTHVVVGTPGRILDHLIKGNLKLDNLKLLIFDEADRMLSMGFYPDMVRVQRFLPERRVHRPALCSRPPLRPATSCAWRRTFFLTSRSCSASASDTRPRHRH
jgi:superfamily II DNA/RNA helicase